jgi:(2S)-methylsuccinyl-CoA dehydrogenase
MPSATFSSVSGDLRLAARELAALAIRAQDKLAQTLAAGASIDDEQHRAHGLSWLATYRDVFSALQHYLAVLETDRAAKELDILLVAIVAGEYLNQVLGGIPMNQQEFVRPHELGLEEVNLAALRSNALVREGNSVANRARALELLRAQSGASIAETSALSSDLEEMRRTMNRFVADKVAPHTQQWHLDNSYVPLALIAELAELGFFALTLPEEFGGLALSKQSMCLAAEELSRGWIAVGSLGTRAEIACELILSGGTEQQKQKWLPRIASGEILPTAVFTEPNTGSDLGSLRTRAVRDGDRYLITGNKTWITHPVRADLMMLMARTNADEKGYKGLSMFLAEKPRGTDDDPFPAKGMSGSEIEVLGYRGMKEYEIRFENFEVKAENLLGGTEGQGFKQLMQTFESARIQTAARAVGVAQSALDLALRYGSERQQFGKPIISFPRVGDKIVLMAAELLAARQLTYHAARAKDEGRRCDVEAGMAKLLAARVAWANADSCVQIHGGNGFALEFPASRVLCDARILNIFEGAAEIQAHVSARRLLEGGN